VGQYNWPDSILLGQYAWPVTARSAETIYALSKRGESYKKALIEISDEIRKGAGSHRISSFDKNHCNL